jgi:hypothetical protein
VSDAIHLAGALGLLLSVGLLCQNRAAPARWLCVTQAAIVAAGLGVQGIIGGAPAVVIAAVLGFALNAVALPLALRRGAGATSAITAGTSVTLVAAVVLVAIALALAVRLDLGSRGEVIGLALAIVLLGLQRTALGADPGFRTLGLLAAQNGTLLAAAAMPDLPPLVLLVAALPIVPGLVAASAWLPAPP